MTEFRPVDVSGREPVAAEPGPAPMLQWVQIADLVIDDRYQRPLGRSNWEAIRRIAAGFSWAKFSPVFCAPVEGGRLAIIDGQHRTHAAALCGFETVPAQIVQMGLPDQAGAFAAVNGATIRVTTWQVFRAALAAGEEWAVACDAAVSAAGCRLMTVNRAPNDRAPGEVYALRGLRDLVAAGKSERVTLALVALLASETGAVSDAWGDPLLRPWLDAVADRPRLTDAAALARFLDDFDVFEAEERVDRFMRERRRAGVATAPRHELVAAEIGTGLDRHLPADVALRR